MRSGLFNTLACLLAAWLAVAAPAPQGKRAKPSATAAAAKRRAVEGRSDSAIEADFRARMARSKVGADNFTIHVQGGVATLEGSTDVQQHKGVATKMAKASGASAVRNNIRISAAGRAQAAQGREKARRRAQVKRSTPAPPTAPRVEKRPQPAAPKSPAARVEPRTEDRSAPRTAKVVH